MLFLHNVDWNVYFIQCGLECCFSIKLIGKLFFT